MLSAEPVMHPPGRQTGTISLRDLLERRKVPSCVLKGALRGWQVRSQPTWARRAASGSSGPSFSAAPRAGSATPDHPLASAPSASGTRVVRPLPRSHAMFACALFP